MADRFRYYKIDFPTVEINDVATIVSSVLFALLYFSMKFTLAGCMTEGHWGQLLSAQKDKVACLVTIQKVFFDVSQVD